MANRLIQFELPNIGDLSDEDLASLARENDGVWTEQTKAILGHLGTSALDLNLNWAKTWTGWQCPSCKRLKPEIARLSRAGVVRCKLEVHHDHLGDRALQIFDDLNPIAAGDGYYNAQRNIARSAIYPLTARFDRVLICSDCNSAEAEAKRELAEIDKHFSFSPGEIAAFIVPLRNTKHAIDHNIARQLWSESKTDFEERLDFAWRMAKRFANGKHRQEIVFQNWDRSFSDQEYIRTKVSEALSPGSEKSIAQAIEQRSVSNDGDGIFSIGKPTPAHRPPTDEEFRLIVGRLPAGREYWSALGDAWVCECCNRNKREICRKSNKGEWTARIHKIRDWNVETDADSLDWRRRTATVSLILKSHRVTYVCQDCRNVVTKLAKLHPGTGPDALKPEDIRSAITAIRANADHIVDYKLAHGLATMNAELVVAVREYDFHWQMSYEARYKFNQEIKFLRASRGDAIKAVANKLIRQGETAADEAEGFAAWLVLEGDRFSKLRELEKAKLLPAHPSRI